MNLNAQPLSLAAAIAVALPLLLAAGHASAGFQVQIPMAPGSACAHGACAGGQTPALSVALNVMGPLEAMPMSPVTLTPVISGGTGPYTYSIEMASFDGGSGVQACVHALAPFDVSTFDMSTGTFVTHTIDPASSCSYDQASATYPPYGAWVDPLTGKIKFERNTGGGWLINVVYRVSDSTGATVQTPLTPLQFVGW